MKAGLAKGIVSPKTKAIVLGPVVVAQIIARELEMLGFESVVVGKPLLPIASPGALDEVRTLLSEFSVRARGLAPELTPYVHPGVSAWAERSELAVVAQELGLNIICPPARILSLFNNRLKLLVEAEQIGVPNLAIGFDPISSIREIEEFIESKNQRFPFVLKSVKGCSGFDLFVVQDPSELDKGVALWIEQLRRNCGEVLLFTERYLEGARHVVVPFVRFKDGSAKFFSSIDASLQCRHRKVIEFCPAVGIDLQVEQQIRDWSMRFIEHCDYVGVGSLEFLVDGSRAFLINAVARLNTSFRLWELVDGTQAVAWQLAAGRGDAPSQRPVCASSVNALSAVSLRIFAEDPLLELPQPGFVCEVTDRRDWSFSGAKAELSLPIKEGDSVLSLESGLLGLLFVSARGFAQAMAVSRGVLDELWIAGSLQTNERFLAELLFHPWVREGMFHAGFVDEEFVPELRPPPELMKVFAAVCSAVSSANVSRWVVGDQWVRKSTLPIRWMGPPRSFKGNEEPGISGVVELSDGRRIRACVFPMHMRGQWQVRIGSWILPVREGETKTDAKKTKRPQLNALVSGRVHCVLFREGSSVPAHETLLIVESLGMLVPHALPLDVRITRWMVNAEAQIFAGQNLAEFEALSLSRP